MKSNIILLLTVAILSVCGCTKPDDNSNVIVGGPTLTTASAQNITSASALLGGNITSEGTCAVVTSGVVLAVTPNPTTSNINLPNVPTTSIGTFTVSATGLLPATRYYARAYAVNCKGINYGNEITFTTLTTGGGGGGGSDTGYFTLTIDGVTYNADDMLGPNNGRVYPEGDTRFALLSQDSTTGEFTVTAQSSAIFDNSKNFGFSFSVIYKPITGLGTYTFTGSGNSSRTAQISRRTSTGNMDPLSNTYMYDCTTNESRALDANSNCVATTNATANNTLTITEWGSQGEYVTGTLTGTMYENPRAEFNCTNSTAHPYSVSFKLKRVQ